MAIKITRHPYTIPPGKAMDPKDRLNNSGYWIEVSNERKSNYTYRAYYLTNREIRFTLIAGAVIGVAIPIARGLLGL